MTWDPQAPRALRRPSGFTLVELMIVILIISMLLAMISVAGWRAIVSARQARIRAEIGNLDLAFRAYKSEYGAFPPNPVDTINSDRHFRKAFPRKPASNSPPAGIDAAEAVVFYLRGYNANPTDPFNFSSGQQFKEPLFDFDRTRLLDADGDGNPEFYPDGCTQPYVYFAANNGVYTYTDSGGSTQNLGTGGARPYGFSGPAGGWLNPTSFQILSAGLDNDYGANSTSKAWPSLNNCNQFDRDNLTNFAERPLEDGQ